MVQVNLYFNPAVIPGSKKEHFIYIADTRTNNDLALGNALLQHLHIGVLPSSTTAPDALPLLDPLTSTSMPESWVRGAIVIRMNSLVRGHSGVRWELIEKMGELLRNNITPMVPLRGSISASGGKEFASLILFKKSKLIFDVKIFRRYRTLPGH